MKKALVPAFALVLGSVVLGATVFRAPLAGAASFAQSVFIDNSASSPVPVAEQNLDAAGNIKVHEQGTANVAGTVDIGNFPSSQSVSGQVGSYPAIPAGSFSVDELQTGDQVVDGPRPAGTIWAVTNVAVTNTGLSSAFATVAMMNCTTTIFTGPNIRVLVPPGDTRDISYSQPFAFTNPASGDCLGWYSPSLDVRGDIVGYYVTP